MVRPDPLPPRITPAAGSKFVFKERAVTTREAAGVLESPTVNEIGPATLFSLIATFAMEEMVGFAFAAERRYAVNVCTTVAPLPSFTVTVMVEFPVAPLTEVTVTIPVLLPLVHVTLGFAITVVVPEVAVTVTVPVVSSG